MDLFSPTNGLWRSQEKGCRPSKNLSGAGQLVVITPFDLSRPAGLKVVGIEAEPLNKCR